MAPPSRRNSVIGSDADTASANVSSAHKASSICHDCKKPCLAKDKAVSCNLCNDWFHAKCQGLTDAFYQTLVKDSQSPSGSCIQWYCKPSCNKVADNFMTLFMNMQTQVQHLRTEVSEVKNKVEKIEEGEFTPQMIHKIENICQEGAAAASAGATPVAKDEIQSLIEKSSKESIAETEERNRRSKNLVVFGINEAKSLEKEDRIREEYHKANVLIEELGSHHKPIHVRRLGEYKPNQKTPRPVRMIF